MQKSKGYALLFLLGALIAGAALGFTASRMIDSGKPHRGGEHGNWKRMNEELGLTPAQGKAIDSLMDRRREQMRELFKPLKPQLDSLRTVGRRLGDSTHAEVRRLLTPAQQVKWDAMRKRSRTKDSHRGSWGESPSRDRR